MEQWIEEGSRVFPACLTGIDHRRDLTSLRVPDPVRPTVPVRRGRATRLLQDVRGRVRDRPEAPGFLWVADFPSWVERKFYLHNMGHALAAWRGARAVCRHLHGALESPAIRASVAMESACEAMARRHRPNREELRKYREDLLQSFANRAMRDPVEPVARDPIRNLGAGERLAGAARLRPREHADIRATPAGIVADLACRNLDDRAALRMAESIAVHGAQAAFREFRGCPPGDPLDVEGQAELDGP